MDMIRDSTYFNLALFAYEGYLQGLPEDMRLRKIAMYQGQEASRHNEDKLRIIRNLYKSLELCISAPAPWTDTIYPAGKAWEELTAEEKSFIEQEFNDRQAHFLANIREIADEQINILIEALEWYVQKCSDGAPTLERLKAVHASRRPPAEQAEEPTTEQEFIGWRGTPEQLEQLSSQLKEQGYTDSPQWFAKHFDSALPPDANGWEGAANLLVYLLEGLWARRKYSHVPQSRLEAVFGIKGYKSKKDGYGRNDTKKPRGADRIDSILSSVFPDS